MSERRFVLVDFKHMNRVGSLRLYEAGQTYALSPAIAQTRGGEPEDYLEERPAMRAGLE